MAGDGTRNVDRSPAGEADVCVVGSGPAGALVANELAGAGHDVVVLEAGPRFDRSRAADEDRMETALRSGGSPLDVWEMGGERDAYTSAGRPYPLNHTRVKGVGGATLHWQGMVMRLHESDFRLASETGVGADWPLSYADLRPYYARAERALGVAGAADNPFAPPREEPYPLPAFPPSYSDSLFADACERLGVTTHSAPNARNSRPYDGRNACEGYGTCQPVCPSGAKYTADATVGTAEERGARVVDRAPVQRLLHDEAGDRVTAAEYATPDGSTHRQRAREFVVACGGVETPRLLLLSATERYPDGLANTSGLVGRYFMDHLFAGVGGRLDEPTRQNHVGFTTTESHQFYEERSSERGAFKLEFLNYPTPAPLANAPARMATAGDDWGDALLADLREQYGNGIAVGALVEPKPRAENRVALDESTTDDHGNPVPRIEWTIGDYERRTIERANEVQRAVLDELGATETWAVGPENTGPAAHHVGTTRMGADPAESVVGPDLRAHDLSNLTLASSSVFPTAGAMNPTLTIAALALKAADAVRARL